MFFILLPPLLFLVYNYVFHPLFLNKLIKQNIPGPWHYKLSSFFILNDARRGRRNGVLQRLHAKYGPVVMIGPGEVSVNSPELIKMVYLNNYPKEYITKSKTVTGFYSQFADYGQRNMFSTGDSKAHLLKRRPLQRVYSKSAVLSSQDFVQAKVRAAMDRIREAGDGKDIDVYSLFRAMAMDVVSGFLYGSKFATDLVGELSHTSDSLEVERSILHEFRDMGSMTFYTTLLPSLWTPVARLSGLEKCVSNVEDWVYKSFAQALECLVQGKRVDGSHQVKNVITTMFEELVHDQAKPLEAGDGAGGDAGGDAEGDAGGSTHDITREKIDAMASEIADHAIAGHETTGTTLTYIFWELSRPCNRHWQAVLREETKDKPDFNSLEHLPMLCAVVQEAFRLHAAIPGSEPRFVPPGETLSVSLDGTKRAIPAGTVVSGQPWCMHHSPVFGDAPDRFRPQRWLQQDDESQEEYELRIKTMNNSIFTFGQGNRMCIGMHLVALEVKLCVAAVYSEFSTEISPEWCGTIAQGDCDVRMGSSWLSTSPKHSDARQLTDVDLMSMADSYVTNPLFEECWLRFSKLGKLDEFHE